MALNLESVNLRIKNEDTVFSTSDVNHEATDDRLLAFAEAYNSLQADNNAVYTVRKVYSLV